MDTPKHDSKLKSHFSSSRSEDEKITLEWKNVNFSILEKNPSKNPAYKEKIILNNISGIAQNGQLVAVMGPTGCGKTSLVNILAARCPVGQANLSKLTGTILINGAPRREEEFRRISAYVLQDDNLYPHLTVLETFQLSASFFLPVNSTSDQRALLVDAVIDELGLRKAMDTIIGDEKVRGVSGGERKRASIGTQLICDPAVLFLDEPTSGLDSFQALSVMESMKSMAENGRLVISVIHQPRSSIFNMFDRLLLLSEGRSMYFGDVVSSVPYFASLQQVCPEDYNPADFFLDILSPDNRSPDAEVESKNRIKSLGDMWQIESAKKMSGLESERAETIHAAGAASIKAIGDDDFGPVKALRNFYLLAWRSFSEQSRDHVTIGIKMFVTILFALIIGGIYSNIGDSQQSIQNRSGLMFFVSINQGFNALQAVLNTFPKEKSIVNRERSGRAYSAVTYFAAKVLVEIPLTVMPSIIYSCILYYMVKLNPAEGRFGFFILILMLENLVAVALGLWVSAMVNSVEAANALGPPMMVIGILFGGFYISVNTLPIVANWIPYLSFFRWTFEALTINEFKGEKFVCGSTPANFCTETGDEWIASLGFEGHTPAYPCFGLGMLLLGFLAAALFFLQRSRLTFLPLGHIGKMHKSMKKVEEDANTVGAQGVELTPPKGENPSAVAVGVTSPAPVTV